MQGNKRNITATNATAKEEILKAAMYSYSGRIIYDKWNEKTKKFDKRSHVVVPIDCGVTVKNNPVLYAIDIDEGQLKAFLIKKIRNFDNYYEKHSINNRVPYEKRMDNIKKFLGIDDFKFKLMQQGDMGMAAGVQHERNLVAKEFCKIAQEIYEPSGCEGHLYSDSKKNPCSYDVIGDDGREGRIARNIVALLSESQRELTNQFKERRKKGLSFGDYFKWDSNGRCYIPLNGNAQVQEVSKINDPNANEIHSILKKEGYVCPDYASGYCYEISDKEFTKKNPPKVLTILKKALKNDKDTFARLSKSFNERDCGTMKRKGQTKLLMCITCNAEDVAGMSTDRDWTSCMRLPTYPMQVTKRDLDNFASSKENGEIYALHYGILGKSPTPDNVIAEMFHRDINDIRMTIYDLDKKLCSGGCHYDTALKQVKYGGMCAYLIREDDKGIDSPLARVAIKRLENNDGGFVFEAENTIYGDEYVANSCNFLNEVIKELEKSNATTEKGDSVYRRHDGNSWSDAGIDVRKKDMNINYFCQADWDELYRIFKNGLIVLDEDEIEKILKSHDTPPPKGMVDVFEKCLGTEFSDDFIGRHSKIFDADKYYFEHDIEIVPNTPYEGDDAPRTISEMNKFLREALGEVHIGDDYGRVDDSEPVYEGFVNPLIIALDHSDEVPVKIKDFCIDVVESELKSYYEDNPEKCDNYSTFALFEDDFDSYEMNDELYNDVYDSVSESLSWEDQINYRIMLDAVDAVDGYEDRNSVFVIDGKLVYLYGMNGDTVAYTNKTVINTEDGGWKDKLKEYCMDMLERIPYFFG